MRVLSQFNEIELMEGPRREFPKSAKRDWQETYGPIVSKKSDLWLESFTRRYLETKVQKYGDDCIRDTPVPIPNT